MLRPQQRMRPEIENDIQYVVSACGQADFLDHLADKRYVASIPAVWPMSSCGLIMNTSHYQPRNQDATTSVPKPQSISYLSAPLEG